MIMGREWAGMTGRTVEVSPERLARWLEGFVARHGEAAVTASGELVELLAADGGVARCAVPYPPLASRPGLPYAGLVDHAGQERRTGVLLVRRGGYAVGDFAGARLVASKVGSRYVQGRTKAGGWSQQRFARRRQQQASEAFAAAADVAARVLVPVAGELEAVVRGGDRRAVDAVLADPRLAPLLPLLTPDVHAVPDPRLRVLRDMPARFRAVRITVVDPPPVGSSPG